MNRPPRVIKIEGKIYPLLDSYIYAVDVLESIKKLGRKKFSLRNLWDINSLKAGKSIVLLAKYDILEVCDWSRPTKSQKVCRTKLRYRCEPDKIEPVKMVLDIIRGEENELQIFEEQDLYNIHKHK